jgi:hypothetical protein
LLLDVDVAGVAEESRVEIERITDLGPCDVDVTTGIRVSCVCTQGEILPRVDLILGSEKPVLPD